MKLNLQQLKSAAWGVCRVTEDADGFHFFRFTEAEDAAWRGTKFESKTLSTAGVEWVFDTDADALRLSGFTEASSSRKYYAFDLFINGEYRDSIKNFPDSSVINSYCGSYKGTPYELGDFEARLSLGQGQKQVRLVFPWSVNTVIREAELENASTFSPVAPPTKKLVLYGDSITHGYDALHPSGSYAARITEALGCEGFNKAIGGACFLPPLGEAECGVDADIITVAFGTNDWNGMDRETFREKCGGFLRALCRRRGKAKIFVLTPLWRDDETDPPRAFGKLTDVDPLMREICADLPVTVIRGYEFLPRDTDLFGDRKLHPNLHGFEYYARNLLSEMEKYL